uniref:Transcription and mRNA export factor ENY2 n=1 Tax=Zea mays TaxID=4577 RepID=C0PNT3_MAIZE|nr:unknown [Zea mays]
MRASINRPPTPSAEEDRDKQPSLGEIINIKLVETGEKEKLMELLRERLAERGWRDEMKALCRSLSRKNLWIKCAWPTNWKVFSGVRE